MKAEGVNYIVDIHNHVLSGVDDGSNSLEESIRLLKSAKMQGIDVVVASPHFNHHQFSCTLLDLKRSFEELRQRIKNENIGITLLLSHEIFLTIDFYEKYSMDELFPLITTRGEKKILVELPYYELPYYFEDFVIQTLQKNVSCIWVHPERNVSIQNNWKNIFDFVDKNKLEIQITAGSLIGNYGKKSKKIAWKLIKSGVVDYIASDAHNLVSRPFELAKAYELIHKKLGSEAVVKLQKKAESFAIKT
ncbi:tyrosine-protein phosphatase [Enterococcus mundtii]|uniref:Tyrosine-protein phosphatase n=1 Tax=Enterococcus mundtii TaxID=53346 RepID=A0A242KWS5_ENTMU|nr:CpsB/CapC family capsule biosynthesis tyrosine phosphatase [Enterococcus mundtii]OTP26393.1 hypothetical protein A5802_000104 [Enterococcus mundtii]